ncbi:unnamed protein product [Durusdinium trenchii]|uniref:Uncharacterized protein n=1 Tax=Durusdinium trenchii TaxID=1381693 RepID=A0ABP0LTX3_9DINO
MHLEVLRTPSVPSDAMAARLFEELSHQQVQAHVTRFNRMMQLVDPSCWRLTVNMLEVMSTWGLQPDVYSHSIATRAARNAGGHRGWLLSLAFLSSTSTAAVNSSLSAFARFHKWEWSINGAQGLRSQQLQPDTITYTTTMGGRVEWPRALNMLTCMKRQESMPNLITYNAFCSSATGGGWHFAWLTMEHLKHQGFEADAYSISSTISAGRNAEEPEASAEAAETRWRQGLVLAEVARSIPACNALLAACASHYLWRISMDVVTSMLTGTLSPSTMTFGASMLTFE